jgi:MiaB/RimO family radical SAM methylthiotransferase
MKSFYLYNKGTCTRLKLFGEEVKNLLIENDWREKSLDEADLILFNSCSFIRKKEQEFLYLIRKANKKKKKGQKLAVFGCLPKTAKEKILQISEEIQTHGRDIEEIAKSLNLKKVKYKISHSYKKDDESFWQKFTLKINDLFLHDGSIIFRLKKDQIYHLRISEGCLGKCTYCTERLTTKFKSEKICDVIWKYLEGYRTGYRLFSINSDDTAAFGLDRKENIYDLMSALLEFQYQSFFAIAEFNPRGLIDKRIYKILSSKKIFYITVPIQSGSQKILDMMKRPYQIEKVENALKKIKKINRKLKINTHIIVGFPGETEEDFQKTLRIIRSRIFNRVKIFSYSDHQKTESYHLPNKINGATKLSRAIRLKFAILHSSIKNRSLSDFLLNIRTI